MSVLAVGSGGNYIDLPDPAYKGYTAIWQELNKADRNTLGNLIKERITTKFTITAEWHGLTAEEKNLLLSSTDANTFSLRYVSTMDDTVGYGKFYRGSDLEVTGYGRFDGSRFQYYDVKMSLVEV